MDTMISESTWTWKIGDIRKDGYIYDGVGKDRNGKPYPIFRSPLSMEDRNRKRNEKRRIYSKAREAARKKREETDPIYKETRRKKKLHAMLKHKYGMTLDEYHTLVESQNNQCAICSVELTERSQTIKDSPKVDHDHDTGKVRGVLCGKCNMAIGLLNDDPDTLRKAIAYLEKP